MVQLKEEPTHAESGGLLPAAGPPEEHAGHGELRPEEAQSGPVIPEGYTLDFTTRRLVPFVLPDDPAALTLPTAPPDGDDEDEEAGGPEEGGPEGSAESCVQRAQRVVREVMAVPHGWQPPQGWKEPEALLPPVEGAKAHTVVSPVGRRTKERRGRRGKGGPVVHGERVTDERTGKTGHWASNHVTGEHLFIADDGLVYHSDHPVEVAGQQQKIAADVSARREAAERRAARVPPPDVIGEGDGRVQSHGLLGPTTTAEGEEGVPQTRRERAQARRAQGEAQRTAKWRAADMPPGHREGIERGQIVRDFSTSHPVRRREVDNVLYYFDRASPEQYLAGEQWYPAARALAERWAVLANMPLSRVVGVIAAASPQTGWNEVSLINNLQQAHDCIFGDGDCSHWSDSPKRPEKGRVPDPETGELLWKNPNTTGGKMQAIKEGTPVDQVLRGRKVWNFYLSMMGIHSGRKAVIDRHMIAIIGGDKLDLNEAEYDRYARTVEAAARERGVSAEVMQAVSWIKYQQDYAPQIRADKRQRALQERREARQRVLSGEEEPNMEQPAQKQGGTLVVPRHTERAAAQLIAAGHFAPAQHEALKRALHHHIATGAWIPPDYDEEAEQRKLREGPWSPSLVAHYRENHPEEYAQLKRERPALFAREDEPIRPGWRMAQPGERVRGSREADTPAAPLAAGSPGNLLDLRSDRRTTGAAHEQRPDDEAQQGEEEKHGWLTIRREVEGEDGKPAEQQTRIYVGHDGSILAGPHHLIGRALSDLRGEGSLDGQRDIPGLRPEPYHSVGRQTGGPSPFQDEGKVQHGDAGRELDSWLSHERSKRLFQPEDHLNSLVRRGFMGEEDAQALLERAKADRTERAERASGL